MTCCGRSPNRFTTHSFPLAGELQIALADGFAEGLVRRDGGEPFGLGLALGSQEVNQTQGLTLRRASGECIAIP